MYYKDAQAAILVYDITVENSWEGLLAWYERLKQNGPANIVVAIAANKDDLADQETVDDNAVKAFIKQNEFIYARTSAKTDQGISQMFTSIAKKLDPSLDVSPERRNTIKVNNSA
jgi:Ras-related protein Rab-5C